MASKTTGSAKRPNPGKVLVAVDPADLDSLGTSARETLKAIVERYTTLTRLGHDLGRSMQWVWRIVFSAKSFPIEKAAEALHALGVPLSFYFSEVTRDEPEVGPAFVLGFFREEQRLPSSPFLHAHLSKLKVLAETPGTAGEPQLSDAHQRELEALRFKDWERATRELESSLLALAKEQRQQPERGRLADIATLLAIWGSAQMSRGRRADACDALVVAIELATASGHGFTLGVVLQRAAYLLAEVAQLRHALRFFDQAALQFAYAGAYPRLPGILIGRGIVHQAMGLFEESTADLLQARTQLPAEDWRLRAMAANALAVNYEQLGNLTAARAALTEAVELWQVEDLGRAPMLWRHGSLALAEGRLAEADSALRDAMELYEKYGDPLDSALVSLDLARCLIRRQKLAALRELGRRVLSWRPLFANNPIAAAALIELACVLERAAAEACIHAASLQRMEQALQSADLRRRDIVTTPISPDELDEE